MGQGSALIRSIRAAFDKLEAALEDAGPRAGSVACEGGWTVKQLLAVRVWWSNRVVDWVEAGLRDEMPVLPAVGYSWRQTPELNDACARRARRQSYRSVRAELRAAMRRVEDCIAGLTERQLAEPRAFAWAGKWPLSRWLQINTERQFTTARTLVRRAMKR